MTSMTELADLPVDPDRGTVTEHGWQSWTPTTTYALTDRPHRPVDERTRRLCYRPGEPAPPDAFLADGLLVVDPGDGGPLHLFGTRSADSEVPGIRADVRGGRIVVSADSMSAASVEHLVVSGPGGVDGATARWAEAFAERAGVPPLRAAPTLWCSWYHYFTQVGEADILENLDAMDDLELPVDVVQLDDGYQAEIGDWLALSGRFASVDALVRRIRDRGRRAGIWTAPFFAGARSQVAARHPEWLVRTDDGSPLTAAHHWDQDLFVLDTTHPGAAEYLAGVFHAFRAAGIDFYKTDFVYAAALPGRRHSGAGPVEAYRQGMRLIREAVGPDAYLLGCGAPMLPSVGLVDAMRVSPDTGHTWEPGDGDLSQPSVRAAVLTGRARAFTHGRFWVADPDCLIARPGTEQREAWAEHIGRYGGLRATGDRLRSLDDWGLETTRRLLTPVPATPFTG